MLACKWLFLCVCRHSANAVTEMECKRNRGCALAEILGLHVVDFLASRNAGLSFKHGEFRKHSSLTKAQQEYVREAVEEYFARFFDAVDCLGGNPLPEPLECHSLKHSGDSV